MNAQNPRSFLRDEHTAPDPIFSAIKACRLALEAYGEASKADHEGNGETPEVIAAGDAYRDAWNAVLASRPTTMDGVTALARTALELSVEMGSHDYEEEALRALAGRSVASLVQEARDAEDRFVAALEVANEIALQRDVTESELAVRDAAVEREHAAFAAAITARPGSIGDVELILDLFEHRSTGSMVSPDSGLLTMLGNLRAFVVGQGIDRPQVHDLPGLSRLARIEIELRENARARETFEKAQPDAEDPHYDRHWELRERIDSLVATNVPDLMSKVYAAHEAARHDHELFTNGPGSFKGLAQSVMSDICRMAGREDLFAKRFPILDGHYQTGEAA